MKKKSRKSRRRSSPAHDLIDGFIKGAVSTALLHAGSAPAPQVGRQALRAGVALATASLAARAARRGTLGDLTALAGAGLGAALFLQSFAAVPTHSADLS